MPGLLITTFTLALFLKPLTGLMEMGMVMDPGQNWLLSALNLPVDP